MTKCKYCSDDQDHIINDCTNEIYLNNKHVLAFCGWCGCWTKVKINYCPMCGRKLEETNEQSRT